MLVRIPYFCKITKSNWSNYLFSFFALRHLSRGGLNYVVIADEGQTLAVDVRTSIFDRHAKARLVHFYDVRIILVCFILSFLPIFMTFYTWNSNLNSFQSNPNAGVDVRLSCDRRHANAHPPKPQKQRLHMHATLPKKEKIILQSSHYKDKTEEV